MTPLFLTLLVANVEALVKVERPKHRIIHVRDLHFVPKDAFAQDLRDQTPQPDSEITTSIFNSAMTARLK